MLRQVVDAPASSQFPPAAVEEAGALILPTGVLVDRTDPKQCADAILMLRKLEEQTRQAKAALTEALAEHSRLVGSKTFSLEDGRKVEIRGGERVSYDGPAIIEELRALGCPEETLASLVIEEVSYKPQAAKLKQAARANEDYGRVIESNTTREPWALSAVVKER